MSYFFIKNFVIYFVLCYNTKKISIREVEYAKSRESQSHDKGGDL